MRVLKIISFLFILFYCSFNLNGQISFGTSEAINDHWKFTIGDPKDAHQSAFDDQNWEWIDLPHDWSVKGTLDPSLASCTGYLPAGIGWYRKRISIPVEQNNEKIYLYFEGVYNRSEVYINGTLLGTRPNGYVSFYYDATDHIKFGEENVIAVRVDHSRSADSRWYTGSGIYRKVWLVHANPVHLVPWGVFTYPENVSEEQGTMVVEVAIENGSEEDQELKIENTLRSSDGIVVSSKISSITVPKGKQSKVIMKLPVNDPALWSIEHPNLYQLRTKIIRNEETVDATSVSTGIRWFDFDPDKGFALNGKWMKIKGVCLHHDAGVLGSAVPRDVWELRLKTLKSIGCNAVRTSHNPQAPAFYELCDELGLLVMNEAFDEWEFPKRKWLEGWNVGTPGYQGSYEFFETWAEKDLADMVRRDRNHPSIFTWSIGNEVDYPNDPYSHPVLDGSEISQPMYGGYQPDRPDAMRLGAIAKRLVNGVKKYDSSRPVTAALAGVVMSNETEFPDSLDIVGYNYTEHRYVIDHQKYPKRVIYGSENRHDLDSWKMVADNDFIFGQFLWTGIDYLGESGRWPSRGFYSGLLDFGGSIKPRGYFRKALWSDESTVYLGTYRKRNDDDLSMDAWPIWNYEPGEMIRVVCYTNTAKARLFLNGELVGFPKDYDEDTGIIHWDIPYVPGILEVQSLNADGEILCEDAIQTSGEAERLTAHANTMEINKDGGLAIIRVQVVDADGVPVVLADDEVICTIDGPAMLLGLEASNNSDMSDYTDNQHRVYHGRILAYIKGTGESGAITVKFESGNLDPANVVLLTK